MRKTLSPEMAKARVAGPDVPEPYGMFKIMCPVMSRPLGIIAVDGRGEPAGRDFLGNRTKELTEKDPLCWWEHVSVSGQMWTPNWAEMCWVKDQFWLPEEVVLQFHVPPEEHVNIHHHCLHMWRPIPGRIPVDHTFVKADYDEPLPALSFISLPRPPHIAVGPLNADLAKHLGIKPKK